MAEQKGGLSAWSSGEMISGKPTNLVGLEDKDIEAYKATQEDLLRGLDQRYAQPNWFNIAAGFAKPQLGGFTASLGSAAGAYGEQQEKQRDIQIPIFKIRSELAAYDAALKQKSQAASIVDDVIAKGGIPTPQQILKAKALEAGPSAGLEAGQTSALNMANNARQDIQAGMNYVDSVGKYGKALVDKLFPEIVRMNPALKIPQDVPADVLSKIKPKAGEAATVPVVPPEEKAKGLPKPEGVSQEVWDSMPFLEQQKLRQSDSEKKLERKNILTTELGKSSSLSVPVFEQAKNLYEIASDPLLAPAFALGEKGDPLAILVKGLESQTLSSTLAAMREQIQNARFGSTEDKNKALTKFKLFESQLNDFRTRITAAYPNQTDIRTELENLSVPGVKNTQDAFLRGISRIASDNLSRPELGYAFRSYMERGGDPNKWETSDEYSQVMENLGKRNSSVLGNEARRGVPDFMSRGLDGMFKPKKTDDKEKPPATGTKPTTKMGDAIKAEIARREAAAATKSAP